MAGDSRTLAEGLGEIARRRAVGPPRRRARPPSSRPVSPARLLEIPGAGLRDLTGDPVFSVRRAVREILPCIDVTKELSGALEQLRNRDPERVDRGLRPARHE